MDALDELAAPAADLLGRVDALLARYGAPADHPMWTLTRRVRALPGEAVGAITELRPGPLAAAGTRLRELLRGYDDTTVPAAPTWRGAGAERFGYRWAALCAHSEGLVGRLDATAGYLDSVADWLTTARLAVARTVAIALVSAEAAAVRTVPADAALSAADLAAHVLTAVARVYDDGRTLLADWPARLAELPFRAEILDAPTRPEVTEVVP